MLKTNDMLFSDYVINYKVSNQSHKTTDVALKNEHMTIFGPCPKQQQCFKIGLNPRNAVHKYTYTTLNSREKSDKKKLT